MKPWLSRSLLWSHVRLLVRSQRDEIDDEADGVRRVPLAPRSRTQDRSGMSDLAIMDVRYET